MNLVWAGRVLYPKLLLLLSTKMETMLILYITLILEGKTLELFIRLEYMATKHH